MEAVECVEGCGSGSRSIEGYDRTRWIGEQDLDESHRCFLIYTPMLSIY